MAALSEFESPFLNGVGEPDGTYVFTFVLHGTVNGSALVITASAKIKMVG